MKTDVLLKILLGLLIVAELVIVPIFIKVGWPKSTRKSAILKCSGSFVFILTAVVSSLLGNGFTKISILMIAGFVMSLIGDYWLDLELTEKNKFFGIISFFFAHIFYIFAFSQVEQTKLGQTSLFSKAEIVTVAGVFIVAAVGSFVVKMDMGKLFVPVALYSLIICAMTVKAIFMCFEIYETGTFGTITLVTLGTGGFLFIVSDIILAFMYFKKGMFTKGMRIANLVTYFSGQMLLALSLINLA